ncbi:MAG: DUF4230 domain-containing protein [Salinivirgaceae bacterium]
MRTQFFVCLGMVVMLFASCRDDRSLVVGKIKKSAHLATTQFTIDKLVYGVQNKKLFWAINLNESRFLAQTQAVVKAGIDLDELKEEDISIDGQKITLKLPPVRVITFSYPSDRFKELKILSKEYAFNLIPVKEKERFFRDAELDIRQALPYMNITKTTQQKTRILFQALLRNLGYTEIYIEFKEGELLPTPVKEVTP